MPSSTATDHAAAASRALDAIDWRAFDDAQGALAISSVLTAVLEIEASLGRVDRDAVRSLERLFQSVVRAQTSLFDVEVAELERMPRDDSRAIRTGILRRQATVLTAELQRALLLAHQRLLDGEVLS